MTSPTKPAAHYEHRTRGIPVHVLVRRQTILEYCPNHLPADPPTTVDVAVAGLDSTNLALILQFRDESVARRHQRYLDSGKIGVLASVGSDPVGHAWATLGAKRGQTVNGFFRLGRGEALVHDCHVAPAWRGKGIYPAMVIRLCENLASAKGPTRILVDAASANEASLKGLIKAGFTTVGSGVYVQIGGVLVYRNQHLRHS